MNGAATPLDPAVNRLMFADSLSVMVTFGEASKVNPVASPVTVKVSGPSTSVSLTTVRVKSPVCSVRPAGMVMVKVSLVLLVE